MKAQMPVSFLEIQGVFPDVQKMCAKPAKETSDMHVQKPEEMQHTLCSVVCEQRFVTTGGV